LDGIVLPARVQEADVVRVKEPAKARQAAGGGAVISRAQALAATASAPNVVKKFLMLRDSAVLTRYVRTVEQG
jgi:hypothetical protein